jgi:NADH-quinone oxidoreductase subunit N
MNFIVLSAIWGIVMMLSGVFLKNISPRILALVGAVLLTACTLYELTGNAPFMDISMKDMVRVSGLNLTFLAVVCLATLVYFLLSGSDIEKVGAYPSEYFALIFFSLCGVGLSVCFNNLMMLFLGIEIMSIPMYILTGADKKNLKSNEAALKYFLMGAFSTGILMMGIALLYGGNSTASFYITNINIGQAKMPLMMVSGMVMLLAAMSFKVSAAPFHSWTPDVYDGAPTVFTSFMSTVVKAAGFFAFIRLFESVFGMALEQWQHLIVLIIFLTLFVGNITAIFQQSVKRMLAYSSIAQAGFMMFALFSLNSHAKEGIVLYGAAYSFATIGLFAILAKMQDYTIDGFNGLASRHPLIAFSALIFLLSLTGVPLTGGFQGKFWMLLSAVENGHHIWLVIAAVCFAAISAYYYFRVIQAMYFKPASESELMSSDITRGFNIMLLVTVALILILGIFPEALIGWIYHQA